jgi:hypothetical protein
MSVKETHGWPGHWPYLLAIGTIATLTYGRGMTNPFVAEDFDWIASTLPRTDIGAYLAFQFRPLPLGIMFLVHQFWGARPEAYHLLGLLLHILCAISVFYCALLLTQNRLVALLTACVFVVYPRHHQAVLWMCANYNLLATGFYLLAVLGFITYLQKENKWYWLVSVISFALGLLSGEMVVTLVPVIACLEYMLFKQKGHSWRDFRRYRKYVPYLAVLFLYGLISLWGKGAARLSMESAGYHLTGWGLGEIKAFASYLIYLVFPHITLRSLDVTFSTILLLSIAVVGLLAVWLKGSNLARFWVLWIALTLIPFVFFVPFGNADRYFYLPSVGFSALCALIGFQGYEYLKRFHQALAKAVGLGLLAGYLLTSIAVTQQQINDWRIAGEIARECIDQVTGSYPEIVPGSEFYVANLPTERGYAYIFLGGGFQGALRLAYGDSSLKVFVTRDPTTIEEIKAVASHSVALPGIYIFLFEGGRATDCTYYSAALLDVLSSPVWYSPLW